MKIWMDDNWKINGQWPAGHFDPMFLLEMVKIRWSSASSGTVIMSLQGDLGGVIFGQDVHAVIEYLCKYPV